MPSRRPTDTDSAVKPPAAKRPAAKKTAARKSAAKTAPAKKPPKKPAAKKTVAGKPAARKSTAKQPAAKQAVAKKTVAGKARTGRSKATAPAKKESASESAARQKAPRKPASKPAAGAKQQSLGPVADRPHPRITNAEYRQRRQRLMTMMEPGTIALIPAAKLMSRTRVTSYPFRQDSDFYYLTGFEEPGGVLVLAPGRAHAEAILFCAERDPGREQWEGEILGPERAIRALAVDDAFPVSDMQDILPGLIEGRERIYITLGEHPAFDAQLMGWVQRIRSRESGGAVPPGEFIALKHLLHELRLYKSAAEQRVMQRAADISAGAHARAMRTAQPGLTEADLETEILYEFMRQGARHPAYPTIVGAGANACILHYMGNRAPLRPDDLVLIDAGCEFEHYAADITRTFPVSGRFSASQQALYELVLAAQEAAIAAAVPGNHFNMPHAAAVATITQGLIDLGLLQGDVDGLIEAEAYRAFAPSKTSHWLGIDVHDVGDYRVGGAWRTLEPGMVMTIEPGVYIPQTAARREQRVATRWRGLGVRIEDDVLITASGNRVLTEAAPKAPADITRMMRRRL